MFFYLGGCLDAPYVYTPPVHSYIPYIHMPPRGVHTPICSPYSSVHLYVLRGGCKEPPYMWDTSLTPPPVWGCLPFSCTPTKLLASLCISRFWGYWYVIWGFFLLLGFGGCSPSIGVQGASAHVMSICSFL